MSSLLLTLALSTSLALQSGVASTTRHDGTDTMRATVAAHDVRVEQERSFVEVDNRHFNQATVYLLQGARSVRLGIVNGLSTDRFVIPADVVRGAQPVRFAIRPLASRRTTVSDQIVVTEGDTVELFVPGF